jgi:16S rRNA processing protein RimM
MQRLVIAIVVGAHGIRGEVKLRPVTEFPERIPPMKELRLRLPEGEERSVRVLGIRHNNEIFLARLEGVESRDDAEDLRGAEVLVDAAEAAPLPEGRYYEHEILGLRVFTPDGEELGRVEQVIPGASNDVYVAGRWMIPATHDAVLRLAPEEGVLVVRSKEYLEGEEVR